MRTQRYILIKVRKLILIHSELALAMLSEPLVVYELIETSLQSLVCHLLFIVAFGKFRSVRLFC